MESNSGESIESRLKSINYSDEVDRSPK